MKKKTGMHKPKKIILFDECIVKVYEKNTDNHAEWKIQKQEKMPTNIY